MNWFTNWILIQMALHSYCFFFYCLFWLIQFFSVRFSFVVTIGSILCVIQVCHPICVYIVRQIKCDSIFFPRGKAMPLKIWQHVSHYIYKSVGSSLSVSPMTDFEIILPNRLHHYLLLVTHEFASWQSPVEGFPSLVSSQRLRARREYWLQLQMEFHKQYTYTQLCMGTVPNPLLQWLSVANSDIQKTIYIILYLFI